MKNKSIFTPYKTFDMGLAELLTLTVSIKDDKKGLKGQIIMALARLEQTVIQNYTEGVEAECHKCGHLNTNESGICAQCLEAL